MRITTAVIFLTALSTAQVAPPHASGQRFAIAGTVVDAVRGGPVHDVEVSIRTTESNTPLRSVITAEDGRFEFRNLSRGKYALVAAARGYPDQAFQEHGNYSTAIAVGDGLQSQGLVFPIKPEALISGTITDEFNEPVPGADVMLFVAGSPATEDGVFLRGEAISDDTGAFHFSHLPEGKYYVVAKGHPWYAKGRERDTTNENDDGEDTDDVSLSQQGAAAGSSPSELDLVYPTTYYPNVTEESEAAPIVLKPGDRFPADFHLSSVPALTLRLHLPQGNNLQPVSTISLQQRILGRLRQAGSVSGDASRLAEFSGLAPGRYTLRVPGGGNTKPSEIKVDLVADADVTPGNNAEPLSTIAGKIQFDGASPNSAVYLRLFNFQLGETVGGSSPPNGTVSEREFKVEGAVPPGEYNIRVFNAEGYVVKTLFARGARVAGHQLEIVPGNSVYLTIGLTKGVARMDGVALQGGQPASQVAIFLVPEDPAHNLTLFRRDQSDSDGTFSLREVLPGKYTLIAVERGWELEWSNASVLKPFLASGVPVRIEANQKYQIKVEVQPRELATETASQ